MSGVRRDEPGEAAQQPQGQGQPVRQASRSIPSAASGQGERHGLMVDGQGFVFVDGVKVARAVRRGSGICLQFCDRDRRRAARRGTRYPEVGVGELVRAVRELERVVGEG